MKEGVPHSVSQPSSIWDRTSKNAVYHRGNATGAVISYGYNNSPVAVADWSNRFWFWVSTLPEKFQMEAVCVN